MHIHFAEVISDMKKFPDPGRLPAAATAPNPEKDNLLPPMYQTTFQTQC